MDATGKSSWDLGAPIGGEQTPSVTRFTLIDAFALTASCAAGLGLVRLVVPARELAELPTSPLTVLFALVLPCLFGGLVVGHPLILALHYLTRRRQGSLTICEACGLMPAALLATVAVLAILTMLPEPLNELAGVLAIGLLVLGGYMHALVSVVCFFALPAVFLSRANAPWTDRLGAVTAVFPGGVLVLLLLAPAL